MSDIQTERNHNIRQLYIVGNKQVLRVLQYIYKDAELYLERKHKKFQEFINVYCNARQP